MGDLFQFFLVQKLLYFIIFSEVFYISKCIMLKRFIIKMGLVWMEAGGHLQLYQVNIYKLFPMNQYFIYKIVVFFKEIIRPVLMLRKIKET